MLYFLTLDMLAAWYQLNPGLYTNVETELPFLKYILFTSGYNVHPH